MTKQNKQNSELLETTTYLNGTVVVHRAWHPLDRLTNITSVLAAPEQGGGGSSAPSVLNSFSYLLNPKLPSGFFSNSHRVMFE